MLMKMRQQNKILTKIFFVTGLIFAIIICAFDTSHFPPYNHYVKILAMSIQPLSDTGINQSPIASDTPTLVSDQFSFTEGPAADKEGNIYFTDQPNNKIWKYDIDGKLSLFMDGTGRSNGLYFDADGNIISCADEHNELWSISPEKKIKVLAKNFEGGVFNGPNDVWVNHVNGNIYFTDPYYKRDYWKKDHPHMDEQRVYCLIKDKKDAIIVDNTLKKPNGIIGTPDGKLLYITDIGGNAVYKFNIDKNGTLSDKKFFANHTSDGMTMDERGNVYLTGKGVTVYDSEGQKIKHFDIPEDWTGNICFGGRDKNILFIAASKSIYIVHMNVKGIKY
jgi:gluconolactonase